MENLVWWLIGLVLGLAAFMSFMSATIKKKEAEDNKAVAIPEYNYHTKRLEWRN